MNFQGVYTALVTPFVNDQVDYATLEKLLEMQIAGNVAGIVPVGTTGESPTLSTSEHLKVIEFVIEKVNKRCQIVAGTGANSTAEAVELTIEAKKMGADATLQVTPYYNKPTQEGLYRHFMTVAEKAELPILSIFSGKTNLVNNDLLENAEPGIFFSTTSTSLRLIDCNALISSRIK